MTEAVLTGTLPKGSFSFSKAKVNPGTDTVDIKGRSWADGNSN